MRLALTTFAFLGFLASGCGGGDDADKQEQATPGTYGCDVNESKSGHTCSGGTYENGKLAGDEQAACDAAKGTGKGYSTASCAEPSIGCVCEYDLTDALTDNGLMHATEVFYYGASTLTNKDATDKAFIDASLWCVFIGMRVSSAYATTCYGMGAPYDGRHPGPT